MPTRFAVTALIQTAETGTGDSAPSQQDFLPFSKGAGNSIKQEAISYLDFDYISGGRAQNGIRLVEVKDEKSTDLIQLVAEGSDKEQIQKFLDSVLKDLQDRYKTKILDIVEHSNDRIQFLKSEISSMQVVKEEVDKALQSVGPSPTLVTQMMDLKHDMVKLEQEKLTYEANISTEKVHNFTLKSTHIMNGGEPVWPKKGSIIVFSMLLGFIFSSYLVFIVEVSASKRFAKRNTNFRTANPPENIVPIKQNENEDSSENVS